MKIGRLLAGRTRRILAAALVVLIVGALVPAFRPTHKGVSLRVEAERISVAGGPGVGGTVSLDANLYLPPTLPAPAVIMAHGFGGSKQSIDSDARDLAGHGFVVLGYSARGFGDSTGQIGLDSLNYEVADARALVDWLGKRPEVTKKAGTSDPVVGVTGASYGGALALMLAGTDKRIEAVVPEITWNDLGQSLFPNDVATGPAPSSPAAGAAAGDGVFKKAWAADLIASVSTGSALTGTSLATASTAAASDSGTVAADSGTTTSGAGTDSTPASAGSDPPASDAASASGAVGCGRLMADVCAAYSQAAQSGRLTPALSALLTQSSPKEVVGKITAPTLLVQGEHDTLFGLDQADANARAIAANGTPVALSWYNGGHDGGNPDQATRNRVAAWFEYYLQHNGPAPATTFNYSVAGPLSDTGQARFRTLQVANYPGLDNNAAATRQTVVVAGAAQTILNPPGGAPAGISSLPGLSSLIGTALGSFTGGLPGQTARFTSAPLAAQTVVAGTPRIALQIGSVPLPQSSAGSDGAVLFASLSKVSATGISTLAGSAVAPIRLTDLPTDGSSRLVTIDLPAVAFQVEAGARLQVNVSTTDQAFAGPAAPGAYRISTAATGSAALSIPIVGGDRISAGDIPVGKLIALIVLVVLVVVGLVLLGRVRRVRPSRLEKTSDTTIPLEIMGLRKAYPGGVIAVTDVSFRVERGQVLGLLGPNGAGKTTTLRMVMGLINPSAGSISVFGHPVTPGAEILARIGSFVEGSGFLPHLSGRANLDLYWRATGRPAGDAFMDQALEIAGLGNAIKRRVKTYSQGMQQRLAIAQAMLGLPDLLLLDEPTNGLDPPQIHAMREVLRSYAATGRTVLISSHLLSEVEQTCSHVVVVNLGRTIASGTVAELVSASGDMVFEVDDTAAAAVALRGLTGVQEVEALVSHSGAGSIRADLGAGSASAAIAALVGAGVAVTSASPRNRLEDVFLELVGASSPSGGQS